ncbi:GNAT family N-acetyltransferase [Nocardioides coralli]|uniref:GNAT family N-acetyltransferase n=1 Tax=Nocardioides coralli TaxID=2872154 RepID=UPI001CA3FCB5|nr:GNAT family N-acetyltransferase [Nocardioides coralli]QZY30156.1 GNAT family N-acetyltransferase [Nocardioides coralli]
MELRRPARTELDAAGRLCVAAYEDFFTGAEDFYRDRVADVALRDREAEVWVAADGTTLLGCVTFCPPGSPWRELARDATEGEFRMLSVHPDVRGRGVGQALAALCEARAREHGATRMVLSSLPTMAAAHRVYARLGYTRCPHRDWDPVPGVHLIAFTKELT